MTYIPETLRQAREALLQSAAALHVIAQSLEGADEPAPKSPPPDMVGSQKVEPQPEAPPKPNESPVRHWIIDRPPTEEDDRVWVAIPARPGTDRSGFEIVAWCYAYPGTPWAPVGAIPDEPFDPTCLDRNGWIRSRLPTVEDANDTGLVLLPMGNGGVNSVIAYDLIVPGQPWAPWGSNPGVFEKKEDAETRREAIESKRRELAPDELARKAAREQSRADASEGEKLDPETTLLQRVLADAEQAEISAFSAIGVLTTAATMMVSQCYDLTKLGDDHADA